jgi:hypothetical protein
MASHTTKKRKYRPRPGAVAAALQLGVTYSHLRRILAGQRASKSLLAKYLALKADQARTAKRNNGTKDQDQ